MADKKVSSIYIPDDISFSILSKLPLKSLNRFTCASKSWSLLFQNPIFMKMFCKQFISMHQSLYNDTYVFLNIKEILPYLEDGSTLYLLSGDTFENKVKLEYPDSFQQDYIYTHMMDSGINDILCFSDLDDEDISLWNPVTKELVHVPPSPAQFLPFNTTTTHLHGYGYDHVNDDVKIIRRFTVSKYYPDDRVDWTYLPTTPRPFWEVYSVRSESWKRLDYDMDVPRGVRRRVYLDGVCHWWGDDEKYMVSFNLSSEVFSRTLLPCDMEDNYPDEWVEDYFDLTVLNGFVAMISKHAKTTSFHIYVLGELGVKESWTKLFIVGPLPSVDRPIGVGKKGDLFFVKNDKELACFDLNTQTLEDLGVKGESFFCDFAICKKNFLSIGRKRS